MPSTPVEPFILTPIDNVLPRRPVLELLFFPFIPSVPAADTVATLREGLEKTIQALPLIAGTTQVISTNSADEQQGRLCISKPWRTISEIFRVQDLSNDAKFDYSTLQGENFPVAKLPAATLIPAPTMADTSTDPVFFVQINVITGGFIVGIGTNHSFTDGNGAATVAKVWAAYCKGDDGSRHLTKNVMDRGPLMQSDIDVRTANLGDYPELSFSPAAAQRMEANTAAAIKPNDNTKPNVYSEKGATMPNNEIIDNETFFFSNAKLIELKNLATPAPSACHDETLPWISTNDALCSLLALCMHSTSTGANLSSDDPAPLNIGIAINFRRHYDPPISPDYIGNAIHILRLTISPSRRRFGSSSATPSAIPASIASCAHSLRRSINKFDVSRVKGLVALLTDTNTVPDISKVTYVTRAPDGESLTVTSWAKQGFYECDFGSKVGKVERVRICKFAIPGLIVVAPELKGMLFAEKGLEEGLEVMVGIERKKLEMLKKIDVFKHYATWSGRSSQ